MKALGINQAGLPSELDVSVTPKGMGWALWQRQLNRRTFLSQLQKGTETLIKQQLLAVCTELLQVEPTTKEQPQQLMGRTHNGLAGHPS